jgi:hypothetical protein
MEFLKCYAEMLYMLKTLEDKDEETNKQISELVMKSTMMAVEAVDVCAKARCYGTMKQIYKDTDSIDDLELKAKFISDVISKIDDL